MTGPNLLINLTYMQGLHSNDHHREGHNDINRDDFNLMSQLVSQPKKPSVNTALWRHATTLDQSMREQEKQATVTASPWGWKRLICQPPDTLATHPAFMKQYRCSRASVLPLLYDGVPLLQI